MDWHSNTDDDQAKRHPEPPAHPVHDSQHTADARPVDDAFTDPFDVTAPHRALPHANTDDTIDKLLPELLDLLDHTRRPADPTPGDDDHHPGAHLEEPPTKGQPARWTKSRP